jgi:hypothetical protein
VNGGDDRLSSTEQPVALDIKVGSARSWSAQDLRSVAIAVAEIGACAKRLPLSGENKRAAPGIGVASLKGGRELPDQRNVEEIVRRSPDFDQRHMAGHLNADIVEGMHDDLPSVIATRPYPGAGDVKNGEALLEAPRGSRRRSRLC